MKKVPLGEYDDNYSLKILSVCNSVGIGIGASRTGHGRPPPDGVVDVAVGGYRAVLNPRNQVAVRPVGPCRRDTVRERHPGDGHTSPGICRSRWRKAVPGMCRTNIHCSSREILFPVPVDRLKILSIS